jgi:hypothetical protein
MGVRRTIDHLNLDELDDEEDREEHHYRGEDPKRDTPRRPR